MTHVLNGTKPSPQPLSKSATVESSGAGVRNHVHERAGSALIMVVVTLVMMVLLGTAYIQIARVDRRSTRQLTDINVLDTVRDAVFARISETLKADVVGSTGVLFDAAEHIETYDYPHTNNNVGHTVFSVLNNADFVKQAAGGQFDDPWLASNWLHYEGYNKVGWWHSSNMEGIYLLLPRVGAAASTPLLETLVVNDSHTNTSDGGVDYWWILCDGPQKNDLGRYSAGPRVDGSSNARLSRTSGYSTGTSNHRLDGPDTDGDGLRESRWTWAPEEVRQIGTQTFLVAYRIMDLSGMANVNVMSGISTGMSGNNSIAPTDPRGYYPTDAGLRRLFGKDTNAGFANTELGAVMSKRVGGSYPMAHGTYTFSSTSHLASTSAASGRAGAWLNLPGAAYPGARHWAVANESARYTVADELEMRLRGGLNSTTQTPLEQDMPGILRSAADETGSTYQNVTGANADPENPTRQNAYLWMAGGTRQTEGPLGGFGNTTYGYQMPLRSFRWVRQHLTTMSSASVYAPMYDDVTQTGTQFQMSEEADGKKDDRFQFDLVTQYNAITQGQLRINEIKDRLIKILNIGAPKYLGLTTTLTDQIASEYAVAIQDYTDPDNEPSYTDIGGKRYYGMEVMPFLREAYFQVVFESENTDMTDMPDNYDSDVKKLVDNSASMVIELGNPFDKAVKFSSGLRFQMRVTQGGAQIGVYQIPAGTADLPARTSQGESADEQLVIFSDATAGDDNSGTPIGADVFSDLGITKYSGSRKLDAGADWLSGGAKLTNSGGAIVVELQVMCEDGAWVTYDRLRHADFKVDASYTDSSPVEVATNPTPKKRHLQIALARDGRVARYISNRGITVRKREPGTDGYVKLSDGTVAKIELDDKGIAGDAEIDFMQIPMANHQMFNISELGYIFMYGFLAEDEGDFPSRFSGKDGSGSSIAQHKHRRFLSIPGRPVYSGDGTPPGGVPNTTRLSHAAMVFDHFTTISPRYDGDDNDADGQVDEPDEMVVPGRLNVNTAPGFLMAMTSALPEQLSETEELYHMIVRYRDHPERRAPICTGGTTVLRTDRWGDRGIESLGELLQLNGNTQTSPSPVKGVQSLLRDGQDNHGSYTAIAGNSPKRLYPHPDHPDAKIFTVGGGQNGYLAQERMSRFHYLTNTLTTRSDTYVAYVVIRAYNSEDFTQPPSESLRLVALFDRSGIVDENSQVKLVAFQKN